MGRRQERRWERMGVEWAGDESGRERVGRRWRVMESWYLENI